jgi:hypothetical protein
VYGNVGNNKPVSLLSPEYGGILSPFLIHKKELKLDDGKNIY